MSSRAMDDVRIDDWPTWIEALEAALSGYDDALAGPDAAVFPLVPVPVAAGPLPADLVARTRSALERLDRLTEQTALRRAALAAQLAALPGPRPKPQGGHGDRLGAAFDVLG